jgi:tetratricopeptide (TPR) repeat protein
MVFPRTLSADYAPGVMAVAHGVTPEVILGAVVLLFWLGAAAWAFRSAPAVSAGLGWFVVAVLPVSNLLVPTGILLAERTLYLPSVGAAFVVGGAVEAVRRAGWPARTLRTAAGAAGLAAAALFLRTVDRNPTWMSTYVVLNTLASEHPESYLALRSRASGLDHVGEFEQAARYYELAVRFAPGHYGLLAEAGGFYARRRQDARAEELLRSAISLWEDRPAAYRLLAQLRIQQGRGREAHAIALGGLARAGPDRELWALVSEAYIAKGDLEAALRARRAALGQDATSVHNWNRLADLLEALGRQDQAEAARARAGALEATAGGAGARAGEPGR